MRKPKMDENDTGTDVIRAVSRGDSQQTKLDDLPFFKWLFSLLYYTTRSTQKLSETKRARFGTKTARISLHQVQKPMRHRRFYLQPMHASNPTNCWTNYNRMLYCDLRHQTQCSITSDRFVSRQTKEELKGDYTTTFISGNPKNNCYTVLIIQVVSDCTARQKVNFWGYSCIQQKSCIEYEP